MAYRYMLSVSDAEVRHIALREYPNDFSMQKYIYDRKLGAKLRMNAQSNSAPKSKAERSTLILSTA